MNFVQRRRILVVATILMPGLIAASWRPIAAWLAPAPALPKVKLNIALVSTYPGSGLLYVAAANGYFAQEGLEVALSQYTSGREALAAALEQRVDLGAVSDIPVVFAAVEGLPVAIVATIFTASRATGIVARRDRGIAGVADLKHKAIGVTLRTDSHFAISTMLARHQIGLNQVRVESLPPQDMLAALVSGRVDAVSTWEPGLSAAAKALGENAVMWRAEGRFVFDFNLAGQAGWVQAHTDRIKRLLRALVRARRFAAEHPRQAQAIIVDSMKLDTGIFDTVGPNYHFVVELNQNLLAMLEDQARWAIQNRLTSRTAMPNFLQFINMDALLAVQAEAVTIVR